MSLLSWFFNWLDPTPTPTPPVPQPWPKPPPPGGVPAQMLALHNAARRQAGVPPLTLDPRLTAAAQRHAAECAGWGRLDHAGWDAEIRAAGYPLAAIGQNLEEGSPDAASAFAALLADPPHRANILNPAFTRLGAGSAVGEGVAWWAVNFGD